jgi:hypothetical protein
MPAVEQIDAWMHRWSCTVRISYGVTANPTIACSTDVKPMLQAIDRSH